MLAHLLFMAFEISFCIHFIFLSMSSIKAKKKKKSTLLFTLPWCKFLVFWKKKKKSTYTSFTLSLPWAFKCPGHAICFLRSCSKTQKCSLTWWVRNAYLCFLKQIFISSLISPLCEDFTCNFYPLITNNIMQAGQWLSSNLMLIGTVEKSWQNILFQGVNFPL